MPIVHRVIDETMTHIISPITEQIARDVLRRLNVLDVLEDNIFYNNEYDVGIGTRGKHNVARIAANRCDIRSEIILDPANTNWDMNITKHNPQYSFHRTYGHSDTPILIDKKFDIFLHEKRLPTSVGMEFKLTFKNKELAFQTVDKINMYFGKRLNELQAVVYDYPLSDTLVYILYKLFVMQKQKYPFKKYLEVASGEDITFLVNAHNKLKELVVHRNIGNVLCEFSFDMAKPEVVQLGNIANTHEVIFKYVYQFNRPVELRVQYPSVVNNEMIPKVLRPDIKQKDLHHSELIEIDYNMREYVLANLDQVAKIPVTRLPYFDDWMYPVNDPVYPDLYKPFFIAAFTLDEQIQGKITSTINLDTDLPKHASLHSVIKEALRLQGYSSFGLNGVINLAVFANNVRVDNSLLHIDKDLNLTIDSTVKTKRYHLVVSELMALNHVNPYYMPFLLKNLDFFRLNILRNLKRLKEAGFLEVKKDRIFTSKETFMSINKPHDYQGQGTHPKPSVIESPGVEYEELEGYEEFQKQHIYKNDGYPILNAGGRNGFTCPFRVGNFIIDVTE